MDSFFSQASPLLFHFNVTCEMAIANGTNSYTPPAFLRNFESELELLPVFLAQGPDCLLVKKKPSESFIESLCQLKPTFPNFVFYDELLQNLKEGTDLKGLNPWGWSPAEHNFLQPFKSFCSTENLFSNHVKWEQNYRELYSRKQALEVLQTFIDSASNPEIFISKSELPQICSNLNEVEACIKNWKHVVVKAPWSSSGRGMIVLCTDDFHPTYKKWITGVLKSQGYVMVERMLNKLYDLSFHFEIIANKEIRFLGQASFSTTEGGQYIGNNIQVLPQNLKANEKEFLIENHFNSIANGLKQSLLNSNIYKHYNGVLGIDVLLYKDEDDNLKFQPCLEINLRQNMGTVALAIRELLPKGANGMWQLKYLNGKNKNISLDFNSEMKKQHPLILDAGKIQKGYLPLIEPYEKRQFALYLLVE